MVSKICWARHTWSAEACNQSGFSPILHEPHFPFHCFSHLSELTNALSLLLKVGESMGKSVAHSESLFFHLESHKTAFYSRDT